MTRHTAIVGTRWWRLAAAVLCALLAWPVWTAQRAQGGWTAQEARPRVVVVMDGIVSDPQTPRSFTANNGLTGDWPVHLIQAGFEVIAASQDTLAGQPELLDGAALVVVGQLSSANGDAVSAVRAAGLPVLNGSTQWVEPLGQGSLPDPPHHAISGTTVDIIPDMGPFTAGLTGPVTLVNPRTSDYEPALYRSPIRADGPTLATVVDAGEPLAVWSLGEKSVYFGFWNSADGRNHNAVYWALFDRSVAFLLGRDPQAVAVPTPAAEPPTPTPGASPTPTPTATPTAPPPRATLTPGSAVGRPVTLAGTPYLWVVDDAGLAHWVGDSRALAGQRIDWTRLTVITPDQVGDLKVGDPLLSVGLVRLNGVIYQPKWDLDEPQPVLNPLPDGDLARFGLANAAALALEPDAWVQRYGGPLPAFPTPLPTATATPTPLPPTVTPTNVGGR